MVALTLLLSMMVCIGKSQFSFMVEESNNRDIFLLMNTDIVGFRTNNSLMIIDKATVKTIDRIKQYITPASLSRQSIKARTLQQLSNVYTSESVEICITNRSKTLLLQDSPSKCKYEQSICYPNTTQVYLAQFVFSRLSDRSNTTVPLIHPILTDFSFKQVSLPLEVITRLISFMEQHQTYCHVKDNLLHCRNISGSDFYNYQLQIVLEGNILSLLLNDLLRDCQELRTCSFWVSTSMGNSISLGSVILRRYSIKFAKNRTQFSEICYQNQPFGQTGSGQFYYKLTTAFVLIIAVISLYLHRNYKGGQTTYCPDGDLF